MQQQLDQALALQQAGRLDEAEQIYHQLLAADPNHPALLNNLSNILKDTGRIEEATDLCKQAVALDPTNAEIHSSLCYKLHFHPDYDRAAIFNELREWSRRHGNRPILPHDIDRTPNRRLKIGYVSPDFYGHAETFFVLPLLRNHDRAIFEIHCYSSVRFPDKATSLIKSCAEYWHDVADLTDDQLAAQIRSDKIDILVDLTMHMAFNRLGVFAQKPAPVQITWLAYPGGTGLDTIDYHLTDPHLDPPGESDQYYSEKPLRLPESWICFDPLGNVSPVGPRLPGPITFGSLNNPCKLNQPTLTIFKRVLKAVPDSKLLLLVDSETQRNQIRKQIDPARLRFVPRQRRGDYLRTYDQIDIALDPLAYNGITTTCDALWMGVPVLTLPGQTASSRAGLSILSNLGLSDLIATDEKHFRKIAVALAENFHRRSDLRVTLRDRMMQSPVTNAPLFARNIESAYRRTFQI